jgi:hypothetical protein
MCPGKPPWNIQSAADFIRSVGSDNLYLAPSVGLLLAQKTEPMDMSELAKDKIGLWLISAPEFDVGGNLWNTHAPLATGDWRDRIAGFTSLAPDVPMILDAVYQNWDEVYKDLKILEKRASR